MSNDWFRSWHGAPTDPKWRTIAKRAGVPTSLVVSFVWALMDRASQADERGSFAGADLETLADFLDCEESDLRRIVTQCDARNVTSDERFVSWAKRQPKREGDSSKDRTREYRERLKKQDTYNYVTQCDAARRNVTLDKIREDNTIDTNVSIDASPKPKRAKAKTKLSEDAQPTERDKTAASEAGLSESAFREHWRKFRDYHTAHGSLMADWQAAWRTWLSNISRFQARAGPPQDKGGFASMLINSVEAGNGQRQNSGHSENILALPVAHVASGEREAGHGSGVS